jgi:hypothetical protein
MWQLADLARWLDPRVRVLTVVHSPRGSPSLEERGLLRAMAQHSERLIVMTWYGWHSLVAAYGLRPAKLAYIPHGVDLPQQNMATPSAAEPSGSSALRRLLAGEGCPAATHNLSGIAKCRRHEDEALELWR